MLKTDLMQYDLV